MDYIMFGASMLTRLAVEFVIVFFVLSGFSLLIVWLPITSVLQFLNAVLCVFTFIFGSTNMGGSGFYSNRYWHPQWYDGKYDGVLHISELTNE
jgi:hypothetical protein